MEMIELTTVTLDVRPMRRGSEKSVVEGVLGREPGVHRVEANPVAQTATVSYDPAQTSLGRSVSRSSGAVITAPVCPCPRISATRSQNQAIYTRAAPPRIPPRSSRRRSSTSTPVTDVRSTTRRPRAVRAPFAARGDGAWWSCGDVDGVDSGGHAQSVPRRDRVRRADHVVVEDGR